MLLAFMMVNSPLTWLYNLIHHTPVSVRIVALIIDKPLILWINEGLMVFFFLLVGFEIKREILEGQLSTPAQIVLPGLAALGGMAVPAFIYIMFNASDPAAIKGWAIPTATDIVLALAILSLLGSRVPASLRIFLMTLAIFDDIGAIVVIALFYSEGLSTSSLAMAAIGIAALVGLNLLSVTRTAAYVVVGVLLWVALLKSGVHATLAGVVIGFAIPLKVKGKKGSSPLHEMEYGLRSWLSLGVVPLFAFLNSGISLSGVTGNILLSPVALGVGLGLFIGKQIGVFGAT